MNNPSASIIIVTYNSGAYILKCLNSIVKQKDHVFEIIVVDNNSSDDTVERIKNSGIEVRLLAEDKNLGFAKANNLAVKNAKFEYLIFLNPDTEVLKPESLIRLKESLISRPEFGIIGPKLILSDGSVQKSVRNLPTLVQAFKEYILGIKKSYESYYPTTSGLCEVESVVGACMVIKKEIFEKAGRFNEKYFMYFEDLELCKKVREQGLKIGYLSEVEVKHAEGASGFNQKTYEFLHNSAKKYHGLFVYFLIQMIIRARNLLTS